MNIRFLRRKVNERLLEVITVGKSETSEYFEKELLFVDPFVGVFKGILLTPKTKGPHPGIVAIHGHYDNAEIYRDGYGGSEYPSQGFAILMLTMRIDCADTSENQFTYDFLLGGFTAMGIRSYETILGLKYLRYIPEVDEDRIGLIGHSGGSCASNLTIRVETKFKAFVSDYLGTYYNFFDGVAIDETTPDLYPYHLLINDFSTSSIPILKVPYGYSNGMDEIFEFFIDQI